MSNRKSKRKPKLPARLNDHVIEQLSQKRNCGTGNSNDEIGESEVVNGDAVEKSEEVTGTVISDNQNENLVVEEAIGEKVSDEFPPLSAAYPNSVSPLKSTNPKLTEKVNEITNDNEILNKVNNELSVDPKLNNDNVNKTGNEAKSFANTVKANSVFDNKLRLIPTVEKDGRDVVVFEEDLGSGRLGYARVLVEINAEKEFKDRIEICYKNDIQGQYGNKFVKIEFAWKPPRCSHCKVFGHNHDNCTVRPRSEEEMEKAKNVEVKESYNNQQRQKEYNGNYRNQHDNMTQKQRGTNFRSGNVRKESFKKHMEFRPKNVQGKTYTKNAGNTENGKNASSSSPLKQWNMDKRIVEEIKKSANKTKQVHLTLTYS
ncbi:ATPase, F1/V1/A1 complex, alpha/beta subunit, Zinc knuckle CX2CX4HX4C [Artemisia annua]|uniref:ATPase, F1/V1/A1 complex, alpha/beta subunit, Zinc knuckle CX2CX4HX4C n=1 Tax=Artemisia annua TaxID=35608 RepID=A0A2U1PSS3_ARTAN|nr:ATPase, F1/V1/A1 complex, alpha/beta subunit, Zinc knuckle CX2CX4HX4C [Artemisia annua]